MTTPASRRAQGWRREPERQKRPIIMRWNFFSSKSSTLSSLNQVSVDTIGTSEGTFSVLLDPALHDWVGAGGGREEEQRLAFTSAAASNHGWRVLVHKPEEFPEVAQIGFLNLCALWSLFSCQVAGKGVLVGPGQEVNSSLFLKIYLLKTGFKMMSWYESTKHTFLKVVKWC